MPPRLCYLQSMRKSYRVDSSTACSDWFVPKRYPNFDQPIRHPRQVAHIVENPARVATRAFLPFIRFEQQVNKYSKSARAFVVKARDLKYAGHTDSQIFRHYASLLSDSYEAFIANLHFADCVLAYRAFTPPRCNIHFADEVFRWVKSNAPCVVCTFDVKDFFESIAHSALKRQWQAVLGQRSLPADHYNVFKAVTRYAWVERNELYNSLGISKKQLKHWRRPICTPAEFRAVVRGEAGGETLIKVNESEAGIPQGSAISAVLSNIYMLPIDCEMASRTSSAGGLYRRYCDDILIACPIGAESVLIERLESLMRDHGLALHEGRGKRSKSRVTIAQCGLVSAPPLQYLGFAFDGSNVRIRSQTVAKFFRRMRKAVRRELYVARMRAGSDGVCVVRLKSLYRRFTHLGKRNFITGYAGMARRVFDQRGIRAQLKRHWRELHEAIAYGIER
jgi:RNA-directed DNA polymerase